MLEPACRCGNRISPKPASGPDDSRRRSPEILMQRGGAGLEYPRDLHEHIRVLRGFHQVLRPGEADAGELPQRVHHPEDVLPRRRQTGPDRGAAQVDHPQPFLALVDPPPVPAEGLRVGAHLPAERGEHRVLHLRARDFDHVGVLLFQSLERFLQGDEPVLQRVEQQDGGQPQRRGIGVVGGLVEVEVGQRRHLVVLAGGAAAQLQRAVRQHLVNVHVGAGPGRTLETVDQDVLGQQALGHLPAGGLDGVGLRRIVRPGAQRPVGEWRRPA